MQVTNDTMRRVPPNGRIAVVAVLIGIAVVSGRLAAQSPAASPAVPDAAAIENRESKIENPNAQFTVRRRRRAGV